jgi:hypothetical protein
MHARRLPAWAILLSVAVLVLAGSAAASASVRHGLASLGGGASGTIADGSRGHPDELGGPQATAPPGPADSAPPSAEPTPADEPPTPDAKPDDGADGGDGPPAGTHGAAVSAVARDKDAVGTKLLPNGKTVTNHGQAVSAVARSGAGKSESGDGAGDDGD